MKKVDKSCVCEPMTNTKRNQVIMIATLWLPKSMSALFSAFTMEDIQRNACVCDDAL